MKLLRYRLIMAVLSVGASCGVARADGYPTEQEYFQELPVVLSASRLSQPVSETPNAMTVIDRDMITASGARDIADVFKLVPSMYVGYEEGHTPIVSYRGSTDAYARRMQVLVDGRSIYLPIFGQVDWAELPLDIGDIDRIEVVRGPSAASHGSNSVQGVINILTRHARDAQKPEISARWGDAGVSDVSARFGGAGEGWDYRVTLASRGDSGLDPIQNAAVISQNDDSRTHLINTEVSYRPTRADTLDVRLGYGNSTRQLGNLYLLAPASNTLHNQEASSDFEQIAWLHTFDGNSDLQFNYYHIGRDMKDHRYTGAGAPALLDAVIHRHDLEMQHTLNTSPDNRMVWGIGIRRDSANASNALQHSPVWQEHRLFAHDEWRITPASLVNIGAMAEKNALGQTRVSPRVSYNHHLTPRDTLRASVSVAYRNPEMFEEMGKATSPATLSAGGLGPEKAISREIGYIGQLGEAGSTLDIRAYHDQVSNIIWIDPVSPRSFKSDFNAFYSGLEGTLDWRLGARSRLTVNYSHQVAGATPSRIATHSNPAVAAAINNLLRSYADKYKQTVPLNSASLLFSHDFSGGLQVGAGFYHTDPVQVLGAGTMQPLTRYLDLRIAQRFGRWQSKKEKSGGGEIALTVKNALNDHYFDYSTAPRQRHAYLTATLGL